MHEKDLITGMYPQLVPADKVMRFLNYLIDLVIFYIFLFSILVVMALVNGDSWFEVETESAGGLALFYLLFFAVYILYHGLLETFTKERTIGKYFTRTKVLREDGSDISASDAFKRAVSRLVPFEVFSGFAYKPWHDSWSDTVVIKL